VDRLIARVHLVVVCLVAMAAGCAEEDRAGGGGPDNAYALTCGDLTRQSQIEGTRVVIRAQTALTREPALRRRVLQQGFQRASQSVYFALTEVCKGRGPSFKPARLAVEGVRSGRYASDLCIGPGCSQEVRWLAARVGHAGRVVQLVTANDSSASAAEVKARLDDLEVGLTLRMRIPATHPRKLRFHCAEVDLGERVGDRRLVDDGPGEFNPYGVSVAIAEKQLAQRKLRCVRVPSI